MKNYYILLFLAALQCSALAQGTDSLKYYLTRFKDTSLSAEDRKSAGLKIRSIQKIKYLNSQGDARESAVDAASTYIGKYLFKVDSITEHLFSIVLDDSLRNSERFSALRAISKINTYKVDSFLIANIENFNYLGEHPGGAGGEIAWMYPSLDILTKDAPSNYNLIKPISDNLFFTKTESELYLIKILLLDIFGNEEILKLWQDDMLANSESKVLTKNLEFIKNLKK